MWPREGCITDCIYDEVLIGRFVLAKVHLSIYQAYESSSDPKSHCEMLLIHCMNQPFTGLDTVRDCLTLN